MPRQNTGAYTLPANTQAGPAGTTISSVAANALYADLSTELTNSVDRKGRGAMLAPLNLGNFAVNQVGAPLASTDAARLFEIEAVTASMQTNAPIIGIGGGTSDAITATFAPTVSALASGMKLLVRATAANATATPTFAPDEVAPAPVAKGLNQPLSIGDISGAGMWMELLYDANYAKWILLNPALGSSSAFVGMIAPFAMAAPIGGSWLRCNGQAFSRTNYPALFAAIGTTYGSGDGSTTANVPKLGGYFLRGLDDTSLIDPGRVLGSLQADAVGPHNHTTHAIADIFANVANAGAGNFGVPGQTGTNLTTNGQSPPAAETRPKNAAFPFFIRA